MKKYFLYFTVFMTGAVILIIEIAGSRVLSPFYGSTIFVWSSLISITLGFLALGYFTGGFIADRHPRESWLYSIIFLGGASSLLLIKFNQPLLIFSDQFGFKIGPLVASLVLFALPLFLLSMAGPFIIRLMAQSVEHTGHTSGTVFGISTVGSLVGALLVGFYLIPNFFISSIFIVSTLTIMTIALVGLFIERGSWTLIVTLFLLLFLVVLMPFVEYKGDGDKISMIHHEPSFYADLQIGELQGSRCLFMDGASQTCFVKSAGVSPAPYILEISRLSQDWASDSKILLLGLGGGGVVKVLGGRFSVDVVELDEKIVKLAKDYFSLDLDNDDNLFIDDARSFLREGDKKYDFIISDLYFGNTMPIYMYTQEAYNLMKGRLSEGGVLISNIVGDPESDDRLASSIIRTQNEVFSNVIVSAETGGDSPSVLTHATQNKGYFPNLAWIYKKIDLDYSDGIVILDTKNPLDVLLIESLGDFLLVTKEFFGYKPLFSI